MLVSNKTRNVIKKVLPLTQVRYKGMMDNYLQNRFKLDGNLFCRNRKIQNQLKLFTHIKQENSESIFQVNYEELLRQYEIKDNYSHDENSDSDDSEGQYMTRHSYKPVVDAGTLDIPKGQIHQGLKQTFPSRNKFAFANGVTISSVFDGGNLMTCEQV